MAQRGTARVEWDAMGVRTMSIWEGNSRDTNRLGASFASYRNQ